MGDPPSMELSLARFRESRVLEAVPLRYPNQAVKCVAFRVLDGYDCHSRPSGWGSGSCQTHWGGLRRLDRTEPTSSTRDLGPTGVATSRNQTLGSVNQLYLSHLTVMVLLRMRHASCSKDAFAI